MGIIRFLKRIFFIGRLFSRKNNVEKYLEGDAEREAEKPSSIGKVKCKKTMYKSSHKKDAFVKGRIYTLTREDVSGDRAMAWVQSDEIDREVKFSIYGYDQYYNLTEYFEPVK